jgi:hypothetical protein
MVYCPAVFVRLAPLSESSLPCIILSKSDLGRMGMRFSPTPELKGETTCRCMYQVCSTAQFNPQVHRPALSITYYSGAHCELYQCSSQPLNSITSCCVLLLQCSPVPVTSCHPVCRPSFSPPLPDSCPSRIIIASRLTSGAEPYLHLRATSRPQ